MARGVKVKIGADGSVEADFTGFSGAGCLDEAERLAANLARFGLRVDSEGLRKKTESEIASEIGAAVQGRDPVPTRRE
jgi:hypothetical protein